MPLYTYLHNLPNVLVQIANKMGLQKIIIYRNFCRVLTEENCLGNITSNAAAYSEYLKQFVEIKLDIIPEVRVPWEKLVVTHMANNLPLFSCTEPENSLLCT
jgi:hypothetical protein